MTYTIDTEMLLTESTPVVGILLFWGILAALLSSVGPYVRRAGLVMTLLYVIARGLSLARATPASPQPTDVEGLFRENLRVVVPAGLWFVLAVFTGEMVQELLFNGLGLPRVFFSAGVLLSWVFAHAGLATVLLYALAVGLPRVRGHRYPDDPPVIGQGDSDESDGARAAG